MVNKLSIGVKSLVFKMGGLLVMILGVSMMINGLSTVGLAKVWQKNNISSSKSTMNKQRIEDRSSFKEYEARGLGGGRCH